MALVALVAACATAQDVERAKNSWQGATYEEVLRAWGAPARSTTTADGRYWYTWVSQAVAQPGPSVGVGVPVGSPPPPEQCERTLVFQDGRVIEQHWNGPPSMCADFKR